MGEWRAQASLFASGNLQERTYGARSPEQAEYEGDGSRKLGQGHGAQTERRCVDAVCVSSPQRQVLVGRGCICAQPGATIHQVAIFGVDSLGYRLPRLVWHLGTAGAGIHNMRKQSKRGSSLIYNRKRLLREMIS